MKIQWYKFGEKLPNHGQKIEVVGYHTFCCEHDAEHEITIRKAEYCEETDIMSTEEGYFLLPLYWRDLILAEEE